MSKTVVLGITGSIAAYKAADLAGRLVKAGMDVHVVMTAAATRFIGPLTIQSLTHNPVTTDVLAEDQPGKIGHIDLADRADLLVIAPATAAALARLAWGLSDDAITCVALATRAPVLVAPAMNGKMWAHPATCHNVEILRNRGVQFIGPEAGMLACGYEGIGRLWPVDGIVDASLALLSE